MESPFQIYVDRLRGGKREEISFANTPEFLGVTENELSFKAPIQVDGEAYLADNELLLHLNMKAEAEMPCKICGVAVQIPVEVKNFYHSLPASDVKSAIFDFSSIVREEILIQLPQFAECGNGQCPKRKDFDQYFRKNNPEEEGQKPFADL